MQVTDIGGKKYKILINKTDTIKTLCTKLQAKSGLHPDNQHISYAGKFIHKMSPTALISDIKFKNNCPSVTLVYRQKGGELL